MTSGTVAPIDISEEMRQSYLSYAMSVIVSRALPDARDGLKPVQRRILYAMHDMGLRPDRSHKKSARVVGEVLGKYHPHGDQSVYDAMVRLAQDFSLRYPVIDGQGNFGSIDGDSAAAMRYTEARVASIGHEMMTDLEKETVNFGSNFDETLDEPLVLPASVPSLLVNGSSGIAVGMSTSIPPHNLGEVIDAISYMIDHWDGLEDVSVADLLQFIQGPDFPTGAQIFRYKNEEDVLLKAYGSGRGKVTVRASARIESIGRSKSRIIITELPYQVNKTNLIKKIADLHRDGKLEGLTDLRDESDRNGMRIVMETSRNVDPEKLLRSLYKLTPMQNTFSIIMLALVNGEPRVLTLKQALRVYIDHRLEIVRRRSEYDLRKAEERAHILEGLLIALDNLDEIIAIIRKSKTVDTARKNLIKSFELSHIQASAILDMQLRRLAALERKKLQTEYKQVQSVVKGLLKLLKSPKMMRETVKTELLEIREQYADERRTLVIDSAAKAILTTTDLVQEENCWIVVGDDGTIGRTEDDKLFKIPGRPKETPVGMVQASTRDLIYLVAANGQAVCRYVYDLLPSTGMGDGGHWTDGTGLAKGAHLAAIFALPEDVVGSENCGYITLATLGGRIKRVDLSDLPFVSSKPFTLIKVANDDSLGWASWSSGSDHVLLGTAHGQVIRFLEEEIRPMGLKARGVAGIKMKSAEDGVVCMQVVSAEMMDDQKKVALVWSITDNGVAKATELREYPLQKRNGAGVLNLKFPAESNEVVSVLVGHKRTEIFVTTRRGTKRVRLGKAPIGNRTIKPDGIGVSVTKPNRVVGALRGTESIADAMQTAQQLSLI